jgi:hypothetical protein
MQSAGELAIIDELIGIYTQDPVGRMRPARFLIEQR